MCIPPKRVLKATIIIEPDETEEKITELQPLDETEVYRVLIQELDAGASNREIAQTIAKRFGQPACQTQTKSNYYGEKYIICDCGVVADATVNYCRNCGARLNVL